MRTAKVGDLAEMLRGVTYDKSEVRDSPAAGFVPVLRAGNITDEGVTYDNLVYVPAGRVQPRQLLSVDDVLIATSSGSLSVVGKAARVTKPTRAAFGAFCAVLRPASGVDAAYFAEFFRTPQYRSRVSRLAAGANINNLRREHVTDMVVPLPPLPEQRRIAAILDHADALRAKRRRSLTLLDALIETAFADVLAPEDQRLQTLGSVVEQFRYGTSNKAQVDGVPTLRIPNVIGGSIDVSDLKNVPVTAAEQARLQLEAGDLLFVRTNGNPDNVGRCATFEPAHLEGLGLSPTPFIYASYLIRARLKHGRADPTYVREYLLSASGRRQLKGRSKTSAGQYNINIEGLASMLIPLPPLDLQREFASRVAEINTQRAVAQRSLDSLDELFASLQSRAFSGQL